jgi:hypothetical protein
MKRYFYLIICFLIILSCQEKAQKKISKNTEGVKINSLELVDSLKGYYKQNLANEKRGVMTVDFQTENDTSVFYVSSVIDRYAIKNNPPGYYSIVDNCPVLFYTGIEKNLTFDSLYLDNLYKTLEPFLEEYFEDEDGNIIQVPPNYNPVVWKIEMIHHKIIRTQVLN